jgi:hypothetical protein
MRLNFSRQVKIFAMDGSVRVSKVFNPGEHNVDEMFLKTKYMQDLLDLRYVNPVYVAPAAKKAESGSTAK